MRIRDTFGNLSRSLYTAKDRAGDFGKKALSYIKTGPLYHTLTALWTLPAIGFVYGAAESLSNGSVVDAAILGAVAIAPIAALQYMAINRNLQYKEIRGALARNGYDERMVKGPHSLNLKWYCTRGIIAKAVKEVGYEREFKETVKKMDMQRYFPFPLNPIDWGRTLGGIGRDPIIRLAKGKIKSGVRHLKSTIVTK